MGNTFEAIGFKVHDEDAYNHLAEQAQEMGQASTIYRRGAQLHGYCWKVGDGPEIWTILYEAEGKILYADCRPSFRSRHHLALSPWELTEYDETGEAFVRGMIKGTKTEVAFELQNLTELKTDLFRRSELHVAIAGLAYTSSRKSHQSHTSPGQFTFTPSPEKSEEASEHDYEVSGKVLSCKLVCNSVTKTDLWLVYLETGSFNLDVVISRLSQRGKIRQGDVLSASVWLQGYVLDDAALDACYEGVDRNFQPGDFWVALHRPN